MAPYATDDLIEDDTELDFAGVLPKSEIQATHFLQKHPEYDGRGTIIAIFDTGVDPGASGLQTTTTGAPKIIDVVDCTGSGDVDTSKQVEADSDGCVSGVHGNLLRLNPKWNNPTGKWRVGTKSAFDLFPGGLKQRTKEERRRRWDERQRAAVTAATTAVATFSKEHSAGAVGGDYALKREKEELEARVKLLKDMAEKYEDVGPMVDCVVWHDGERWLAALETTSFLNDSGSEETKAEGEGEGGIVGALADFEPLTNFRDCRRFGTFSAEDALNFAVNIYDEGDILSIVVDAGAHGTHVAGIAAACHPEDPALNGIAPGAQIVSCKIGDTRLGSMETGVGLTRALITVLENKCDLINMSYGEATATPNAGRFVRLAEEIVNEHDVIFVSSAGNAGPALSTVGAPGGSASAIMGIGAYVTPALAKSGHSLRETLAAGTQYTWSSRGPAPDGDLGVSISAPGGAIAPVPQWTTQKRQLMNGTSMASPCACGGLALVVSGMKAESQAVTPARVRRAVENTAALVGAVGDPTAALTYGRGLLQVADAFSYLQKGAEEHLDDILRDMRVDVTARRSDSAAGGRGIYLREPADTLRPVTFSVEVKPGLKRDADVKTARLEIDLKLALRVTAPWVKAPAMLMLHNNGRNFEVEVDPTDLPEGLHYAEIQGIDVNAEWRGPLFRLPVTVIRPVQLDARPGKLSLAPGDETPGKRPELRADAALCLGPEEFVPGKEMRRFVAVPEGATWAELKITSLSGDTPKSLMVRATSILPHTRYTDSELRTFIQLAPSAEHVSSFAVSAGATLELTIAQMWSNLGEATLNVELHFHGVQVAAADGGAMALDGAGGPLKILARAPLRREKIKPTAKLDTLRIPLRPSDSELTPLRAPRDVLPGGRTIHRLILTYKLSLTEGGKVTPRVPLLNRFVYDGEIEAQMYFICDANKQVLSIGDIYPEACTMKKGDYTVRLCLRHDDPALLETMRTLPMVVERSLGDSALTVPVYGMHADAVRGEKALTKERPLCPGERAAMFLGPVPEDKLPKDATPGRQLVGKFCLGQTSAGKDAPGTQALVYVVPPKKIDAPASGGNGGAAGSEVASPDAALAEALRDAEVKFLSDFKTDTEDNKAAYARFLADLITRYTVHLPLLREALKRLAATPEKDQDATVRRSIVEASDTVLNAIDMTDLAVNVARKCPEEGLGAEKRKKEIDEKKAAVIEALAAKCAALMELEEGANTTAEEEDGSSSEVAFAELRRWVDPAADAVHAVLLSRREERAGRLAGALSALDKVASPEDKPASRDVLEQREKLFKQLGWGHWAGAERARMRKAFPTAFPPV